MEFINYFAQTMHSVNGAFISPQFDVVCLKFFSTYF